MADMESKITSQRTSSTTGERDLWVDSVGQLLITALGQVSNFEMGEIRVQYEIRKATPEHPYRRCILTGHVTPMMKVSEIVRQTSE